MKQYSKPNYEIITVICDDVLTSSNGGITINNTNAGFDISDERL